ncbi:flagellar biosynthesis protein FlhF [Paenibacillus spongiae]|uniref:Flagellar biosynthesis protein FlhF n=1 Tax=Paenibacillus spongiae TaxID=2909671 RepID=A0ABY5SIL1_9BACL|nr:flagellar biosynthesis protein FlhF [Paenibacillus spongiae]UVI32515.1 flagellar biosynthesis protein FlhF [Paenibacillus spongiae]
MKVKRYVVNALPEALPMIRSDLGVDAIILNTKEIKVGGFLGMFGKKKMEVIAAVEAEGRAKPAPKPAARPAAKPVSPARTQPALALADENASAVAAVFASSLQRPAAAPQSAASADPAANEKPAAYNGGQASELYRAQREAVPASAGTASKEDAKTGKAMSEDDLLNEIRDMKQWIVRMTKQQHAAEQPESILALQTRLDEQEVHGDITEKLINEIEARFEGQAAELVTREKVWDAAAEILTGWMAGLEDEGIHRDTRVVHFVGPTGVGKTTSIAKLAAEQTLKAGRKVGFITSDTYRIAAVDQLRTYATILNVPLEVVFSPSEVARAFLQLEDRELIFMDTAGRNFRNELYVSEVNSLLQTKDRSETYLVLSLTGKFSDMSVVADHFAKYGVQKVLYTKQDETHATGAVLNLAIEQGMKPAYIAYGQTVPDDIAPFRKEAYVKQLLGAPHP